MAKTTKKTSAAKVAAVDSSAQPGGPADKQEGNVVKAGSANPSSRLQTEKMTEGTKSKTKEPSAKAKNAGYESKAPLDTASGDLVIAKVTKASTEPVMVAVNGHSVSLDLNTYYELSKGQVEVLRSSEATVEEKDAE